MPQVILCFLQSPHEAESFLIGPKLQFEHFAAGLNSLQRVTTFVGNASDHLANTGQAFRSQQPLLSFTTFGDVLSYGQDSRSTLEIVQPLCVPHKPSLASILVKYGGFVGLRRLPEQSSREGCRYIVTGLFRNK